MLLVIFMKLTALKNANYMSSKVRQKIKYGERTGSIIPLRSNMNAVQCITLKLMICVWGWDMFSGIVIPVLFVELKSQSAVSELCLLVDCA
jgi:hypothetical protein